MPCVFRRDPLHLGIIALYLRSMEIGEAAHARHADAVGRDAFRAQIFECFIQLTGAVERSDYFTHHLLVSLLPTSMPRLSIAVKIANVNTDVHRLPPVR
jgi:hypothetical protein